MKTYYFFFLSFILVACTLNSEQERQLNTSLTRYIDARNEGQATVVVACTYPPAVAYYAQKGDSIFRAHYDFSNVDELPILRDGSQVAAEAKGENIHIQYTFKQANVMYGAYEKDKVQLVAISENNGKTWFFLDEEDYWNDYIVKPSKRLLSK